MTLVLAVAARSTSIVTAWHKIVLIIFRVN